MSAEYTWKGTIAATAIVSLYPDTSGNFWGDGAADDVEINASIVYVELLGGGTVHIKGGTYVCTATLTANLNLIIIEGEGNTILDFSTLAATSYLISATGTIGVNSALTVNATEGSTTVTVANGALFSAGDWIRIRSEAAFRTGGQEKGEIQKILSVAGNVITIEGYLFDDYAIADTATVDLLSVYEDISIQNLKIIAEHADNQRGLHFSLCHNVSLFNVTIVDSATHAIGFESCVGVKVEECTVLYANRAGYGYGVSVSNATRNVVVDGNYFYEVRHAVSHGGTGTYGVNRNSTVSNNTVYYSSTNERAFDTHDTCEGVLFSGNFVEGQGLVECSGTHVNIIGNIVFHRTDLDIVLLGGNLEHSSLRGNIVIGYNGGSLNTLVMVTASFHIVIEGNYIENLDDNGYTMSINNSTYVDITDNKLNQPDQHSLTLIANNFATDNIMVSGNHFYNGKKVIYLQTNTGGTMSNVSITDNKSSNTQDYFVEVANRITAETIEHLYVLNNTSISGVHAVLTGDTAYVSDLVIDGNVFQDTTSRALQIGLNTTSFYIGKNRYINCAFIINSDDIPHREGTFQTETIQFTEGSVFLSTAPFGYEVDEDGEYTIGLKTLRKEVNRVICWKIWATALIDEADAMRLQIEAYGATSNEPYTTETIAVANKPSETTNFVINDVIYWLLDMTDDGDLDDMLGGDQVMIKVLHEAAGDGDCATDAAFSCVEIEYV